jgi:hypothetical protein
VVFFVANELLCAALARLPGVFPWHVFLRRSARKVLNLRR